MGARARAGRAPRWLALLAVGGLLSVATAAVAAGDVRVGENLRVGPEQPPPARAHDVPGLAVDPADPDHLIIVNTSYRDPACTFHVSFDAGRTWETGTFAAPPGFEDPACPPLDSGGYPHMNGTVAFGSNGTVYAAFTSERDGTASSVVARSDDGGRSFAPAVVAMTPGSATPDTDYIRPALTVVPDPAGDRVHVAAWGTPTVVEGFCCFYDVVVAASTDGGVTWSGAVQASARNEFAREQSAPVVAPDGTIHLVYRQRETFVGEPRPAPLRLATSTDGGGSWSQRTIANAAGLFQPKIAVDPRDGALYVVYEGTAGGDEDAYLLRSTDGGQSWTEPVVLGDVTAGVAQKVPGVHVGPDGRVHVAWYDTRHAYPGVISEGHFGANVPLEDIYYTYSDDSGETFVPDQRLTDRTINRDLGVRNEIGLYWPPALATAGPDAVFVAWSDSRLASVDDDNQDIFLARVDLGSSTAPRVHEITAGDLPALSVAASRLAWPGGGEERRNRATTSVTIVADGRFGESLAASPLARAHAGPVLVAGPGGLSDGVAAEVERLRPVGALIVGDSEALPDAVVEDLVAAGVPADAVERIAGADAAGTAAAVARRLDSRSDTDRATGVPAFEAIVIANPAASESAGAIALASARRLPYLLVAQGSVPAATAAALEDLAIDTTLVIGGTDAVSDAVEASLPNPTRLAGAQAVMDESLARSLPGNVLYVGELGDPLALAVAGAAVARRGGLAVLADGADATAAFARLAGSSAASPDQIIALRIAAGDGAAPPAPGPGPAPGPLPTTGGGAILPAVALLSLAALARSRRRG